MFKTKRSILFLISCFLIVCLILTGVFILSKTFSQNQKQEDVVSIPNNILQLTNSAENDIIWSEEPNEIIINNNDGTLTKNIYAVPVKFTNSNGETQYIDTSMTKLSGEHAYGNSLGIVETLYPNHLDNPVSISNEDSPIEMQVQEYHSNAGKARLEKINDEEYVVYDSAFGKNTQLRYCNTYTGLKEDIVLQENIGVNKFAFIINTYDDILKLSEDKSMINVCDSEETEKIKYTFQPLFAYDSYNPNISGEDKHKHYTDDCFYELESLENGRYKVTITVSEDFLNDEKTVYPVIIDPTVSASTAQLDIEDTYTRQTNPSTNYYVEVRLRVGNYNGSNYTSGHCYTYVRHKVLPSIPTGSTITDAKLVMKMRPGQSTAAPCRAYMATSSWVAKTLVWNTNPTTGEATESVNQVNFKSYTFNVTSIVSKWYNNTAQKYGFKIGYTNENYADMNLFYSSDCGDANYAPALSITYTEPVIYDLSIDSVQSPENNGQYYLNDSIPISAVIKNNTSSSVSNVPVNFSLINTDTNATVNTWSRTVQTIGANSTATVTIDNWSAQAGNYRLDVSVNSSQSILENNTNNNTSSVSFNVNSNIYQSYGWVSPTSSSTVSVPYSSEHLGARIQCSYGDAVVSVDNATVLSTGYNEYMGYYIIMQTSTKDFSTQKNYIVRYTNLQSISVSEGNTVSRGTTIGTVGVTGYVNIPSLYIDVNNGGVTQTQQLTEQNTIDPCEFW